MDSTIIEAIKRQFNGITSGLSTNQPSTSKKSKYDTTELDNAYIESCNMVACEVSKLCAKPNLTRHSLTEVIQNMGIIGSSKASKEMVAKIISCIDSFDTSATEKSAAKRCLHVLSNPLRDYLSSEQRIMAYFKQKGTLVPKTGDPNVAIFDLKCLVKNFLQMPGVYEVFEREMKNIEESGGDSMDSFMKGSVWVDKKSKMEETESSAHLTIPFALYFDIISKSNDANLRNSPSGFLAVFMTFPSLPNNLLSSEESTFLVAALNEDLVPDLVLQFQPFFKELCLLQQGVVPIKVNEQDRSVQFCLAFAHGSQEGLQILLGLEDGCLFCSDTSGDSIAEKDGCMYQQNQKTAKISIKNLQLHQDVVPDFVEDWLKNICLQNVNLLLKEVIPKKISLHIASRRFKMLKIQSVDSKDLEAYGPDNLLAWLESLSEEEILRLICYLPFAIGDFIPENNCAKQCGWDILLELREFVFSILGSNKMDEAGKQRLYEYLKNLKAKYYENGCLPQCFHAAVHYPRTYLKFGPMEPFLAIRAAVRKIFCHVQDLTIGPEEKSLVEAFAWKQQMIMNERFCSKRGFNQPSDKIEYALESDLTPDLIKKYDLADEYPIQNLKVVAFLVMHEQKYQPGKILISDDSEDMLEFVKIQHILQNKDCNLCLFLCHKYTTECYNEHYGSYQVQATAEPEVVDLKVLKWKNPVEEIFNLEGNNFIVLQKPNKKVALAVKSENVEMEIE